MSNSLVPVRIVGLMPADAGVAVFLGNETKTFSIHVDNGVGTSIAILLRGEKRERPLTHDLIKLIFQGFSISVERIVINDLKSDTYYARITLKAENEIHKKITEIDARPSDCLAIALQMKKPIFVHKNVWDKVSDISPLLEKMKENLEEGESETDEEEF